MTNNSRDVFRYLCLALIVLLAMHVCATAEGQGSTLRAPETLDDGPSQDTRTQAQRDLEARGLFQDGKDAYSRSDYRAAWEKFRQAYVLSRRPELLFNIGQAADRLGHTEDALTAFRMYLKSLPDADNASAVSGRIAELEAQGEGVSESGNGLATEQLPEDLPPTRDGLLVRGSLGLGLYWANWEDGGGFSGNVRGLGISLDASVGYTLLPGLAVGGVLTLNYQPSPSLIQGDRPSEDMDGQLFWTLGPQATYYLAPKDHGGYFDAGLVLANAGGARRRGAVGTSAAVDSAFGFGVLLGGGYDLQFDGDYCYGLAGRATLASLSEGEIGYFALVITANATATWY